MTSKEYLEKQATLLRIKRLAAENEDDLIDIAEQEKRLMELRIVLSWNCCEESETVTKR